MATSGPGIPLAPAAAPAPAAAAPAPAPAALSSTPGTYADLDSLLRANGFPQYIDRFASENLDLDVLKSVTSQDAKVFVVRSYYAKHSGRIP